MIIKELQKIVLEERASKSIDPFILNCLKEHLQIYVLYFIYTHPKYMKSLIFTGGNCLRHFYGLDRLSEDIDFDCPDKIDPESMMDEFVSFFAERYSYKQVRAAVKQQGEQILLKFPVLKELGLRHGGSELLLVKVDWAVNPSRHFTAVTTSKSVHGFNFAARHFDLPCLMAGKLHAVLTRQYSRGKGNVQSIKGRDYFDLLWFIKQGVQPNLERLSQMLGEKSSLSLFAVGQRVDSKVEEFSRKHRAAFEEDLAPLIRNPEIIKTYVANYAEEYTRCRINSFAPVVTLFVRCQKCAKEFPAGISVVKENITGLKLDRNRHACPFCGHVNELSGKDDYLVRG